METPKIKPFEMDWEPIRRSVPDWFRDAKFGLFFHWGPYCVPAYENEWYSRNMYIKGLSQNEYHIKKYGKLSEFGYKDFYKDFTGDKFDPDAWADLIVLSGAKYAGPVAEHADNFSMWNSNINPVNSVNYGPKRDVVGELERAIKARDIKFIVTFHHQWLWGWFMSSDPDADVYYPSNEQFYGKALPIETNRYIPWHLPDDEFNYKWMQKVIEVIDAYDPDLIYFDSRANIIDERFKYKLLDYYYNGCKSNKEKIITYKQEDFPKGTGIIDIECGQFSNIKDFVWQTDDRLEAKRTWCYVENPQYKSAAEIIYRLCDIVSKNGNLLLNVGPRADGSFADEAASVLKQVGNWLKINGEAIYGTRPFSVYGEGSSMIKEDTAFDTAHIEEQTRKGIFSEQIKIDLSSTDIRFTTRGNILYAIFMGYPEKGKLQINSLKEGTGLGLKDIEYIDLLGGAKNLEWKRDGASLTIMLRGKMPSEYANVVKIVYKDHLEF